jgi:hypothetical protein
MRSRAPALFMAACFAALVAGAPSASRAYCRASNCGSDTHVCTPSQGDDCGIATFWGQPCVGIGVQKDASSQITFDVAREVLRQSIAAWEASYCDGEPPGIHVVDFGAVDCGLIQYNDNKSNGGNTNVLVFRDDTWPHDAFKIALTTATFSTLTGEIYDADIEVNTKDYHFTTGDTDVEYDLLSVITHEVGHFYGLAHSPDLEATMFSTYVPGTMQQRTLELDDMAGLCSTYPPATFDRETCNPIPRHGFSPACLSQQKEGDCSVSRAAGAGAPSSGPAALLLGALGMLGRALRSRGRSARRAT